LGVDDFVTMPTRSQQIGLAVLLVALAVYVCWRVLR
jgi:hypothetical protein